MIKIKDLSGAFPNINAEEMKKAIREYRKEATIAQKERDARLIKLNTEFVSLVKGHRKLLEAIGNI